MKIPSKKQSFFSPRWVVIPLSLWTCVFAATSPHIKLLGVSGEIKENILASLTQEDNLLEGSPTESYRQLAEQEILLALQPYGYYNAKVQSEFHQVKGHWQAIYRITLGPPTRVTLIHFTLLGEGSHDPVLADLLKEFPLKKGEIFSHEQYEQGKKALLSKVMQHGYINAFFSEHLVEVNPHHQTSEIFLTLQTLNRHYFGPIHFENSTLSNKLLNRYLPFHEGEIYSPDKMLTLQSALTQSDYFSSVNVKSMPQTDSTHVPVMVELVDAKPNQYQLGAGFGTDTGVRGKLGWTRRQLNSRGHRFSVNAQLAEIYRKGQVEYSIPGKRPQSDQLKFIGGYFEDQFSDKPSQIFESGVVEERKVDSWQRRISLMYHHEQFFAFENNDRILSKLILPSVTFIQIKRDNPTVPTRGRRIELTMRGSIDALISDTSFFQTYLQLKWLHAFTPSFKALMRNELGITLPGDSDRLPLSQRFFAGGDLSLRGYGYRSLPSEIDKEGNIHPVGGAYLGITSIELVKTVKDPIGIFTFVDAGNAFRTDGNTIAVGAGVGLEWQTKLGPIKLAIAKPLTDKPADAWRIHATFGPEL